MSKYPPGTEVYYVSFQEKKVHGVVMTKEELEEYYRSRDRPPPTLKSRAVWARWSNCVGWMPEDDVFPVNPTVPYDPTQEPSEDTDI